MTTRWLTVVTVVKDDSDGFARTVASLAGQQLDGVEYLVIDSSIDRNATHQVLTSAGASARVTWTAPAGIYAAMNVGLTQATGEFVYFLNAADTLAPNTLRHVHAVIENTSPQWLFGDVEIVGTNGICTRTPQWDYATEQATVFSRGLFPPHQGTFVRTALLREVGGFDTSYAVAADYAAFLRFSHITPVHINMVIASFSEGGTSTVRWHRSVSEFHRARRAILDPTGALASRERINTARQFVSLGAYRTLQRLGLRQ